MIHCAFDDCFKAFNMDFEDSSKPKVFDCVAKPSLKNVLDMRISADSNHLYCLEGSLFQD
jgi:hypothetical protein